MRTYPLNSPQAAARIVTLAMISDGHLSQVELDVLDRLGAHTQLGMSKSELHGVTHALCEDLLAGAHHSWSEACRIDAATLAALMYEIDDADLRLKVLNLSVAVIEADEHIAEGESSVLLAAVEHWGLRHQLVQAPACT